MSTTILEEPSDFSYENSYVLISNYDKVVENLNESLALDDDVILDGEEDNPKWTHKWDADLKNDILNEISDYLYLYLYKEAKSGNGLTSSITSIKRLKDDDELKLLKKIHFLLSDEVAVFIETSKKLVRNLSHSTRNHDIISRGMIRGSIDWCKTYEERSKEGFKNGSIFACKTTNKIYDLPENQLFKFLINRIISMTRNSSIGDKTPLKLEESEKDIWHNDILRTRRTALQIRKNSRMRDISDVDYIKPKTVRKAFKNKNNQYKAVVDCYLLYRKIFLEDDNLENLMDLINKQILEPMNDNKLYEIYLLFKLIEVLPEEELKLNLLRPNGRFIAQSVLNDKTVSIYYQKLPKSFKSTSKRHVLSNIYRKFGIGTAIPDIIVEIEDEEGIRYRIIEVKNSVEKDYLKEGLNEVLAYLTDFEDVCFTQKMKGILIGFGGIGNFDVELASENDIAIFDKESFNDEKLRRLILYDSV